MAVLLEQTTNKKGSKLSIRSLMNQSTIYRRHEARLAKSIRLKDDPRPAFLRVMSLLPGFNLIVPPFRPDEDMVISTLQPLADSTPISLPKIGEYSEHTLFESGPTEPINTSQRPSEYNPARSAAQAMFATAIVAGATDFAFGAKEQFAFGNRLSLLNTFTRLSGSPSLSLHGASLAVLPFRQQNFASPNMQTSTRSMFLAASATSALFGSKVLVQESMDNGPYSQIFSSAVAGSMAALVRGYGNMSSSTSLTLPRQLQLPRHIAASVLYFGTYDYFRPSEQLASRWDVAVAGAMSGCVYATVMIWSSHGLMSRLFPALLRAAPTHALMFTSYEAIRHHSVGVQHVHNENDLRR